MRQDFSPSRKRRRIGIGWQPVALVDMEDGEALEETDTPHLFARRVRLFLLGLGNEGVGVDDERAVLAAWAGALNQLSNTLAAFGRRYQEGGA